jgi:hypothetical protein
MCHGAVSEADRDGSFATSESISAGIDPRVHALAPRSIETSARIRSLLPGLRFAFRPRGSDRRHGRGRLDGCRIGDARVVDARAIDAVAEDAPVDASSSDACDGCGCVPTGESCSNGVDDDCDTLIDCADPDCADQLCLIGSVCAGGVCCRQMFVRGTCEGCTPTACDSCRGSAWESDGCGHVTMVECDIGRTCTGADCCPCICAGAGAAAEPSLIGCPDAECGQTCRKNCEVEGCTCLFECSSPPRCSDGCSPC